ncbi:sugar phosphate isomerase/epimerase [Rhizobium sp. MC63]|uniref:Sugar phosphate isomerase/epimerase family protein n=1 Tax=Rhizobium mulingense TaxID=3031128 RepID=A0ACC6MXJ2_9HYPH|nr:MULTISPECIES: sugar phosphate isomerase/epimerase family protein [unclassified Rhizobium]MDF0698039.1 sugar phosphate isomerase/epimerase [Rhizobium sp. MC63]MEA3518094.1 sugar phosphate isomerase/epimerase family protein [Rhizobium sp. MJ31]
MNALSQTRFATRLNSFASGAHLVWPGQSGKPSVMQMAERAARVQGLTDLDLNYPDHVNDNPAELSRMLGNLGLQINGFAMRYYTNPDFKLGAFTHPEEAVRREAIELTKKGIDAAREAGANLMTIWLGQDGFDYAFQADYARLWQHEIDGIREVCQHDPDCLISIEYKPNEPRSYSLLPDAATTLLAIKQVGAENLGVTLDFAHVLYADEQPAFAAALIARHSRVLGVHLNDGYAKRDDGLMVGAVHTLQTVELLRQVRRDGYDGAIYFDTFPDMTGLDPVRECEVNIKTVQRMLRVVDRLEQDNRLSSAIDRQDAVSTQAIVQELMLGADH